MPNFANIPTVTRMATTEKGKLWIVTGFTGTGKTTFVKRLISKVPDPVIFDVNNEYNRPQYYGDTLPAVDDWLEHINRNVRNKIVIVDEATIFFKTSGSGKKLTEALVRKRHTGNTYILNFHFLGSVPNDVLAFANYFVLFKTKEREDLIRHKLESEAAIWKCYKDLQTHPNQHEYRVIKRI